MQLPLPKAALLLVLLFAPVKIEAQQNSIDQSFHAGVSGSVASLATQPDGKLIVAGAFNAVNGQPAENLTRLQADGSIDPAFVLNGVCNSIQFLSVASDAKIICQGRFTTSNGQLFAPVFRLNPNGAIDETFQVSAGTEARKIALQTDGKVIISFSDAPYLERLNEDGSQDTSFQPALIASKALEAGIDSLALQNDGKVLVGGTFNTTVGAANLVRLNPDGSLDSSYSNDPGALLYVYGIFVQNDDKAIVSGKTSPYYGASPLFRRLNSDRGVDATFANDSQELAIAAQSGNALYTKGRQLLRLGLDGSVDDSFSAALAGGSISSVAIQLDGNVVAGGSFSTVNGEVHNNLVRFTAPAQGHTASAKAISFTQPCNDKNTFCTTLNGIAGERYVIEASTDFTNWSEIATEIATESGISISFARADLPNPCFFRAKLVQN